MTTDTSRGPTVPPWSAVGSEESPDPPHDERPPRGEPRRAWPWVLATVAVTVVLLGVLTVQWFNRTFPVSEDPVALSSAEGAAVGALGEANTSGDTATPTDPQAARREITAVFTAALDRSTDDSRWTAVVHGPASSATALRAAQQRCPDIAMAVRDITFSTPDFAQITIDVDGSPAFGWAELVDGEWMVTAPSIGQIVDVVELVCEQD